MSFIILLIILILIKTNFDFQKNISNKKPVIN